MKKRLFLILFAMGMLGVVSFLLVDLTELIALAPKPDGAEVPTVTTSLKFLGLIQPAVLLALAVFGGVRLAHQVGLSAPFAEALARRGDAVAALKPQLVPGIVGGLAGGLAILLIALPFKAFMSAETIDRLVKFGRLMPLPTRILYGGITEELLLRWGFMTLLVWLAWRFIQRRRDAAAPACFIGAIVISSIIFAFGHLPIAFLLFPEIGFPLIAYVIIANSVFGLIAGYLYWKKGLESAMLAHIVAHLVMVALGERI